MENDPINPSNELKPLAENGLSKIHSSLFQNPWMVFLGPFFIYMAFGSWESALLKEQDSLNLLNLYGVIPARYTMLYSIKVAITALFVAFVWRGYPAGFRVTRLAVAVGAVGLLVWVVLASIQRTSGVNEYFGLHSRPSFDPWAVHWPAPIHLWGFLTVRFFGLAVLIPVIEEMFLRGFVMRFATKDDWWNVPWGTFSRGALIAGLLVPACLHPGEVVAALAWFGMIHWLYFKTRNVWDCVVAHSVTNLLLGLHVMYTHDWWLW